MPGAGARISPGRNVLSQSCFMARNGIHRLATGMKYHPTAQPGPIRPVTGSMSRALALAR